MSAGTAPALTAERRAAISKMVAQNGAVRVAELVAQFGVHAATIRRDLDALEEEGVIRRAHGGAIAAGPVVPEGAQSSSGDQKIRIARAVCELIADGETIFLGPGALPLEVARCLGGRSRLTVVTNGLDVAHWVAANTPHTLIVTGGQAEGRDLGLVGQLTKSALSSLRADHVILELDGVSAVDGLTDDSLPQAEIAQALFEIGVQIVVVVPAERMGRVAAVYIAPVSDVDVVVTAREAPAPFLWDLSESGVRIVLV